MHHLSLSFILTCNQLGINAQRPVDQVRSIKVDIDCQIDPVTHWYLGDPIVIVEKEKCKQTK